MPAGFSVDGKCSGDEGDDLFALVYDELRQLAHSKMAREYVYSTLQGTALVNEAWLRLGGDQQPRWKSRGYFFAAAAEAMRRILVERARKRKRSKHGGELQRVAIEELITVRDTRDVDDEFLQINDALEKLEVLDPRKAELVKLRYFFGLSLEDAAKTMGISRSWLHRVISSSYPEASGNH